MQCTLYMIHTSSETNNTVILFLLANVFKETFKTLSAIEPEVLYPIPNFSTLDQRVEPPNDDLIPTGMKTIFLSINRYERKKNLGLAIEALCMCVANSFKVTYEPGSIFHCRELPVGNSKTAMYV